MDNHTLRLNSGVLAAYAAIGLLLIPNCHAATLWTGPTRSFTESAATPALELVPGKVVLERANRDVLFNTAAGENGPGPTSPAGTQWAFGNLNDFATLSFKSLESMRNGNLAALILNKPMVLHLIDDDIYLAVTFTAWGRFGAGGFALTYSTAAQSTPPSVSITGPAAGAIFAAPARLSLTADATVSGGTVTKVEYFAGATSLGSTTAAPFQVSGNLAAPGAYALTAVATASGVTATSAVVNVTVIMPASVSLSAASVSANSFSFQYAADPGLTYLVQISSNLVNWANVATNVATSNPVVFAAGPATNAAGFYRVALLPNP